MGIHRASHYHNCMGCLHNDILRRAKINGFFANDWLPLPLQYWCWIRTSKESVYVVEGVVLLYIYGIFILQQMRHSLIGITKPSFIKVLYLYEGQYPSLWWPIWLMPSQLHIPSSLRMQIQMRQSSIEKPLVQSAPNYALHWCNASFIEANFLQARNMWPFTARLRRMVYYFIEVVSFFHYKKKRFRDEKMIQKIREIIFWKNIIF